MASLSNVSISCIPVPESCFPCVPTCASDTSELLARVLKLERDLCVLRERDDLLNELKLELVAFPAAQGSAGSPGQVALSNDQVAFYVDGEGWKFSTLTNVII